VNHRRFALERGMPNTETLRRRHVAPSEDGHNTVGQAFQPDSSVVEASVRSERQMNINTHL
jgi:hypothetical protein